MTFFNEHRRWLSMLMLALGLIIFTYAMRDFLVEKTNSRLTALLQEQTHNEQILIQLNKDIADAQHLQNEMDTTTVDKTLAPTNRLQGARMIEHRANEASLRHLTYTISPESKISSQEPESSPQILALSHIIFSATAPSDVNVYTFLASLEKTMQGKLTLRHLSIKRTNQDKEISDSNVETQGDIEWLSNGAADPVPRASP